MRTLRPVVSLLAAVALVPAGIAQQPTFEPIATIAGPADLVEADGAFAYLAHGRTFTVVDLSNPVEPRVRGSYTFPEQIWGFSITAERAYVGANFFGLGILDLSDPAVLRLLGRYETTGQTKIGAVFDNRVALIDHMEGLVVIDVSEESTPKAVGSFFLDGYARDVVTFGPLAYATDSPTGLYVFDLSRPGAPEPVAVLHAPAAPSRSTEVTEVSGRRILTGVGAGELQVYDVSDPTALAKLASLDTPGRAHGASLVGSHAYVADGAAGLQIVDLANPSAPRIVGTVETDRPARDVAALGSIVLVVVGDSEREGGDRDVLVLKGRSGPR